MYRLYFTSQARKDAKKLAKNDFRGACDILLEVIQKNPFQDSPPYKRLTGDLYSFYARRINRQHRLVYDVDEKNKTIKILSMWSHFESLKS